MRRLAKHPAGTTTHHTEHHITLANYQLNNNGTQWHTSMSSLLKKRHKASTSQMTCYCCRACRLATQQFRLHSNYVIVGKGIAKTTKRIKMNSHIRHQPKPPKHHSLHPANTNSPRKRQQCVIVAKRRCTQTT